MNPTRWGAMAGDTYHDLPEIHIQGEGPDQAMEAIKKYGVYLFCAGALFLILRRRK